MNCFVAFLVLLLSSLGVKAQLGFPVANSEKIFGKYYLSAAGDSRVCPKTLTIRDLKPYVSIPNSILLPVSHFVFDGKQCTTGDEKLDLDFGGDNDGNTYALPNNTCFDKKVANSAWIVSPGKRPDGTFSYWDPDRPLVSRFEVKGTCTHCEYRKPFAGKIKEGAYPYDFAECAGKQVRPPIEGFGFKPINPPKFFIKTKCLKDGNLWVQAGVTRNDRSKIPDGSTIHISVESRGNVYSMESKAHCIGTNSATCTDWRKWHRELLVPKVSLKDEVLVSVDVDGKWVNGRRFFVVDGCDRADI